MAGTLALTVDAPDLNTLYKRLKNIDGNFRTELRRGIVKAAQPVADQVKKNAAWSSRIPGAVKVKASFAAKSAGVSVVVDASKAPEGRPLENGGSSGAFRHPVFANQARDTRSDWTWVSQQARPFFYGAADQADSKVTLGIVAIAEAIEQKAGLA